MSAMMSISILVAILTCAEAELCQIRSANDLANAKDCTELELYANEEVMKSPLLYDKIKTATTYRHSELNGTELEKISEAKEVFLPKGELDQTTIRAAVKITKRETRLRTLAHCRTLFERKSAIRYWTRVQALIVRPSSTVTILDNFNLRELPKFNIVDANAIKLSVIGNPKLDTKQLLMECEKKHCSQDTLNNIQVPFSCRAITPMPTTCRVVFGTLPLHLYHYSWGTIQKLYGTITLENSQLKRALKPEMLEQVIQLKNTPVLVVKNNSKLEDIDSLLDLNYNIIDDKGVGPVQIEKNPKLCRDINHAANPFVMKYLKNVQRCYRHRMAEVLDRRTRELQEDDMESFGHKKRSRKATHQDTEVAETIKLETDAGDRSQPMATVHQNVDQKITEISASEAPKVKRNDRLVVTAKPEIDGGTTESVTTTKKLGGLKGFFKSLFPCCF